LDGLPEFHTNAVVGAQRSLDPLNYLSAHGPYFAPDLKQAYSYPSYQVATGAGTAIGIISSSPVAPSDIAGYFTYTGEFAPNGAVPQVLEFPIDGGGPYDGTSDITFEATLDVEMSAGSAPGAQIAVFNVPDANDADLFEAYAVAAESGVDIVSSSFGECEKAYDTPPGLWMLEALHNVFAEGSAQGVTFVAASGDNGAFQCGTGTGSSNLGVSAPTDDPFVVAVGGTTSLATTHISGSFDSAYLAETSFSSPFTGHGGSVWGSGGGYSALFGRPLYQNGFVASAFRGVPDLAMHMGGPASGDSADWIRLGGQFTGASGTSAAAPEFAGLLALRVQVLQSRLGDIHSWLYASARTPGTFRTGIPGNNGFYGSTTGLWDPVLGLGTPYGRVIAGKPTAALAGIPYITASNP
jgi:subtilase family serine protease